MGKSQSKRSQRQASRRTKKQTNTSDDNTQDEKFESTNVSHSPEVDGSTEASDAPKTGNVQPGASEKMDATEEDREALNHDVSKKSAKVEDKHLYQNVELLTDKPRRIVYTDVEIVGCSAAGGADDRMIRRSEESVQYAAIDFGKTTPSAILEGAK